MVCDVPTFTAATDPGRAGLWPQFLSFAARYGAVTPVTELSRVLTGVAAE
jgi:hypothetical protein